MPVHPVGETLHELAFVEVQLIVVAVLEGMLIEFAEPLTVMLAVGAGVNVDGCVGAGVGTVVTGVVFCAICCNTCVLLCCA